MAFSWHSVSDVIRVCRGNGMALGLMASQDYFLSKVSRLPSWISKPLRLSQHYICLISGNYPGSCWLSCQVRGSQSRLHLQLPGEPMKTRVGLRAVLRDNLTSGRQ